MQETVCFSFSPVLLFWCQSKGCADCLSLNSRFARSLFSHVLISRHVLRRRRSRSPKKTRAHTTAHFPKIRAGPFLRPVVVGDCTKVFFCASCCVYVKNKCVSCYYSGIVRRHYTKPESLPVRSTFSFFFSPTVIRDPSCFDEFCSMRATPPVRLR